MKTDSPGIGAAIAQALAENGADVAITYQKSAGAAESVVASIRKMGRRSVAIQADAMSKSALLSFTRGLSRELGAQGITVNLVLPGSTDTEANPADGESADFQRSLSSVGRYANPREIADAVVFLSSPAAGMVNGSALTVDGGANA